MKAFTISTTPKMLNKFLASKSGTNIECPKHILYKNYLKAIVALTKIAKIVLNDSKIGVKNRNNVYINENYRQAKFAILYIVMLSYLEKCMDCNLYVVKRDN